MTYRGIVLSAATLLLGAALLRSDRLAVTVAGAGLLALAAVVGAVALRRAFTPSPRSPRGE